MVDPDHEAIPAPYLNVIAIEQLLCPDHGIRIASNQVQFSLIDRRPEARMAPLCRERGVHLLAYGTVCGGLLSERYLGQPEPRGCHLSSSPGTPCARARP